MEDTNTDSNQTISLNQDFGKLPSMIRPSSMLTITIMSLSASGVRKESGLDELGSIGDECFDKRVVRGRHRFVGGKLQLCPERIRSGQAT